MSQPFCASCNRFRLTADGKFRNCLFSLEETDVKTTIRSGGTDDEKMNSGADAYGAANARQLITEDLAKARNNADNYGFFCMAMGRHRGF